MTSSTPHQPLVFDVSLQPSTVFVFTVDRNGTPSFSFVSAACAAVYGFTAELAMADVRHMHDAIHPEDRETIDQAGATSMSTLDTMHWQGRIVRSDGAVREVTITSQPQRRADETIG